MLLNSVIFSWFAFCVFSTPALAATVIEFYNTPLDHYFITADANEAAAIDSGSAGSGWSRTGNSFNSGGSTPVCRFYGSQSPGPNSHFYTADTGECDYLKQLQASTSSTQKRWNFESLDFISTTPVNGTCPGGTVPVYRAYNNGSTRNVDSNHRITSSAAAIQDVVNRGWNNEGMVMCAPLCTAPEVWNGTACAVASTATALTLIAGTADSPGSTDGPLQTASFHSPRTMTRDAQGNIYVVDGCSGWYDSHALIRKIALSGEVTSIAGTKAYGRTYKDGFRDRRCWKMTTHPDGNLYVADSMNHIVQRISPQGEITTIAGTAGQAGSTDGTGNAARFNYPNGIVTDLQGNLFIADSSNHTIRKIDSSGNVSTYAGQAGVVGSVDGNLQNANFKYPNALRFDSSGKLYITDRAGIRVVSNGTVSTAIPMQQLYKDICTAGRDTTGYDYDVLGLDVSSGGRIAVTVANCTSVGIYQNNQLSVLLGNRNPTMVDIDGAPSESTFMQPSGVAFKTNGDLVISDFIAHNLKLYSPSANMVSLYTGKRYVVASVDGPVGVGKIYQPSCLNVLPSGEIWFSQWGSRRKIDVTGNLSTLPQLVASSDSGDCVLTINNDGSFIAAEHFGNNLRLFDSTGKLIQTLSTQFNIGSGKHAVVGSKGEIYFGDENGFVSKYANGAVSVFSTTKIGTNVVTALAVSKSDEVFAANGCYIFKLSASGVATQLNTPDFPWPCDYQDGAIAKAKFNGINGLSIGAADEMYVSDSWNAVIRRIYNGQVDTIIGTLFVSETSLGSGAGGIHNVSGITYDAANNSLIIMGGNAILRAQLP